ncbi:MAG TPA: hypothetical protein PK098_12345 [Phycisphaerales bacterium]|nr:hypothetical protein [Phycisphaerales bacterium]
MNYIKITTSEGETRWINLAQVSRVTLATQASSGKPLLVIIFADGEEDGRLTIHGSDAKNLAAIKSLTAYLDELASQ